MRCVFFLAALALAVILVACAPRSCCEALTADCLACAQGVSVDELCTARPEVLGCPLPTDIVRCDEAVLSTCTDDRYAPSEQEVVCGLLILNTGEERYENYNSYCAACASMKVVGYKKGTCPVEEKYPPFCKYQRWMQTCVFDEIPRNFSNVAENCTLDWYASHCNEAPQYEKTLTDARDFRQQADDCVAQGGTAEGGLRIGGPPIFCRGVRLSDGGTPCSDNKQCQGYCLPVSNCTPGAPANGTCEAVTGGPDNPLIIDGICQSIIFG